MGPVRLRRSEWMLVGYFAYVAAIAPFFRDRPHLGAHPVFVLLAVFVLLWVLAWAQTTRAAHAVSAVRDWLPLALTFAAFREMEFFLPLHFPGLEEARWIVQDRIFLDRWHVHAMVESWGGIGPYYLELCYLLVYAVAVYCIALLYGRGRRSQVDVFWTIYLTGTLAAYALFPYFPSRPPRVLFPGIDEPGVATWVRHVNLYILSRATIHAGVFPSAHVSSTFSAAWAMFLIFPQRKLLGWGLVFYAVSVSIATIYGRYHYAADVVAGFGVSLLAGTICVWMRIARRLSS